MAKHIHSNVNVLIFTVFYYLLGLNENLETSIEAVFGKAGVEMEKFIRTMNFWYIYQDFSGLFPYPKWNGQRLLEDGISEDQKTFPLQFGEQLIDFICGEEDEDLLNEDELPENQIPSTTSLFFGVCSSKLARIAFRYFLVFRHVTRKGMYYTFIECIWYNKIY